MEHDDFHIPSLHDITTKTLKLGALCIVRSAAAQFFKSLNDEKKRVRSLLSKNGNIRGSHNLQELAQGYQYQQHDGTCGSTHFHSSSLAEDTLQRYGSPPSQSEDDNSHNLPSCVGADGISYPFKPDDPEYTSRFPMSFRGCFKCGEIDHFNRRDCPLKDKNDMTLLEVFFKELRIHRPRF